MNEDFALEAQCCICDKRTECIHRDDDLSGGICKDCIEHVVNATDIILVDLVNSGILR